MRYRFLILIPIFQFVLAEASSSKPTAIIQAICCDQFTSKIYIISPGDAESNSTNLPLSVGFSIPSQPIAYYGKSPIKFFELDTSLVDPGQIIILIHSFLRSRNLILMPKEAQLTFSLLLLKKKNSNELKFIPFPWIKEIYHLVQLIVILNARKHCTSLSEIKNKFLRQVSL